MPLSEGRHLQSLFRPVRGLVLGKRTTGAGGAYLAMNVLREVIVILTLCFPLRESLRARHRAYFRCLTDQLIGWICHVVNLFESVGYATCMVYRKWSR